jgi:hypothetical protein
MHQQLKILNNQQKLQKRGNKMKAKPFEKSKKDVEKKGVKEGSKKDMAMDKKQAKPMPMKRK